MAVFKCKMCGGTLEVKAGESVIECSYCGNMNTLPKLDDDRRVSLYDRANHYMQNNEYDKAMSTYEKILEEDKTDAEAYWSIVLCRYGIEYVEDPTSHKRIPTINRMQMTSILADQDYKSALKYADSYQKSVYEQQAKDIADIQKGILEIVNNEEPFDVFICYKETDNNGRRTQDSVLAQELYYGLKNEGFKVFFSRITLEDKLGVAYEPYIFSALKSSKVMVVIGTKPEHFNAVWVKNEWSRYLSLIRNGEKKTIIPAYKDMDPYDIPDELSHLQAQDMSKLGFMQDMIRGIKKVVQTEPEVKVVKEVRTETAGGNANVNSLLKRITIFLEDEDYDKAEEYCQKVLDIDPENSIAYLYLAMCEYNAKDEATLAKTLDNLSENGNIIKAKRYAIDDKQREKIDNIIQANLNAIKQDRYNYALGLLNKKKYEQAKEAFGIDLLQGFKDSAEMVDKCIEEQNSELYNEAMRLYTQKQYSQAVEAFDDARLANYKDSKEMKNTCLEKFYVSAKKHYDKNDFDKSFVCLEVCKRYDYKDAQELIAKYKEEKKEYESNKRTYEMAEYDYKNGREKLALPLYKRLAEKNYLDSVDKVKTIEKKIEKRKKRCKYSIIFVITAVLLTAIIVASIFLGQSIQYSQSGLKITNEAVTQILEANEDGSKTIPIEVGGKKISKIKISRNDTCKASKIIIHSNITSVSISSPSVEEIVLAESWTEINASNFTNCPTIKTITIPSSVNSISLGAFSSMPNLENIIIDKNNSRYSSEGNCIINKTDKMLIVGCGASVIPNDGSVTKIGEQAFANCKNIVNVTIPDRVTSIGAGAFSGCSSLTSVTIPKSVTSIGSGAFEGCSSLIEMSIPFVGETKDGSSNTHFGYIFGASSNFDNGSYVPASLMCVTITNGTSVENYAFKNCSNLTSITISDSVTSIGSFAFSGCSSLESVIIPESVTSLGISVFSGCSSLTSVTIPNSMTSIGSSVFSGCSSLTSITIPDSVTSIGNGAFSGCSSLTSITIPSSVTSIGMSAFSGCSSLIEMTIPFVGATKDGGNNTFFGYIFGAGSWQSNGLYVPSSLKRVTITGGVSIDNSSFYLCGGLLSITILDGVTSIGDSAFSDCSSLSNINISNSVKSIGNYVFKNCSNLTNITIPNSVTSIGDSAFSDCSSLSNITISNSVKSIGNYVFNNCSNLTNITIPNSVTNIGKIIFAGCSSLTSIVVQESNAIYHSSGNCLIKTESKTLITGCATSVIPLDGSVTSIGDSAFSNCSNLSNITIPNSVTSIGDSAFSYCSSLSNITIPNSVKNIGNYVFKNCSNLTNITIPNSVTGIGDYTFYGCSSLTNITIPDSVISIGKSPFDECSSLTNVIIGNGVTSISNGLLSGCGKLESLTIPFVGTEADKASWTTYQYPFGYIFGTAKYIGGEATKQYYYYGSSTSSTIPTTYYIPSSLKSVTVTGGNILYGAFYGCSSLTSITIPNSVTSIGDSAFSGCSSLTSITIPDSVTSIGIGAFSGCSSLENMTIPFVGAKASKKSSDTYQYPFGYIFGTSSYTGGVATEQYYYGYSTSSTTCDTYYIPSSLKSVTITGGKILYGAFYNCSSLKSLTILDGMTSIGSKAFNGCNSLTSITIPNSVTSIGSGAFSGCSSLTEMTIPFVGAVAGMTSSDTYQYPFGYIFGTSSYTGGVATEQYYYGYSTSSTMCDTYYIPSSLKSVTVTGGNILYGAFYNCSSLTSITIGNGVTSIGSAALNGCSGLTEMSIPFVGASKEEITNTHFGYIFGASNWMENESYVPSNLRRVTITGGLSIGDYAFDDCSGLTNITISNSVMNIGDNAFSYCSSLTSITIPDSVNSIGDGVFSHCSSLTSIIIPDSITSIGDRAFYSCDNLTNIIMPNSVTSIGKSTFENCSRLTSITIPVNITNIENSVFLSCSSLTSINFRGTKAQWNAISKGTAWNSATGSYTIYCTDGNISK